VCDDFVVILVMILVMVLVMIFRPGGFATARRPSVLYKPASGEQPS
jgi:ABC-type branched-subunit amino acid transport system permease subunit